MRIIDADALKDNMFHYAAPEMVWDRGDIEHKIDEMPTIPAITVEWLKNKREGLIFAAMTHSTVYGDNSIDLCHAVNLVLNMWQKEQEAKQCEIHD